MDAYRKAIGALCGNVARLRAGLGQEKARVARFSGLVHESQILNSTTATAGLRIDETHIEIPKRSALVRRNDFVDGSVVRVDYCSTRGAVHTFDFNILHVFVSIIFDREGSRHDATKAILVPVKFGNAGRPQGDRLGIELFGWGYVRWGRSRL